MEADDQLDTYLRDLHRIRSTRAGTAETSYYPARGRLLNAVGGQLKPRVFCLHHPSGDAGIPDFGLFEQTQFARDKHPQWNEAVGPERGVVEVKGASHGMAALLASKQIREQYLPAHGLVLATNLWQFRLVGTGGEVIESLDLAGDEHGFWALAAGRPTVALREQFAAFLQRCLLTRAPLRRPSDVAFFLASYAREALARLAERAELPALAGLRRGMEDALGIHFDQRDGERLFRSTLVQTLFYGLFSAWVIHSRAGRRGFDWRASSWSLHVPVMRLLFHAVATPEALEPLGMVGLLDGAGAALERVDRPAFFAAFSDAQAVQYFYEPFLEYFDPELRRQLGVWYTPPEIVRYQVERVDRALRDELGVADGLADPAVWVLDPCCGTGSYVVAVLDRIRRTLADKGMGDLAAEALKRAAMTRVVGFEIMTAPFVIAHWQVAELLHDAPLRDGERAAVYLTNALTGWSESEKGAPIPGYEALVAERGAASAVKREHPILVVMGNPPYNAYAGLSPDDEGGLVEPYKQGLFARWGVKKFNLDDLYIRFFRIAERRIAEGTGRGIVSYISNWSWLFLPSYVVMRERLLRQFDSIRLDCLNGDSRETGKLTPGGLPDPSVFSTETNRAGIRVGTAIATLVRRPGDHARAPSVLFRSFWGVDKRGDLVRSLDEADDICQSLSPIAENGYVLRPAVHGLGYSAWPALDVLLARPPLPGLLEKRGGGLVAMDRDHLEERMRGYLASSDFEDARRANPALAADRASYDPRRAQTALFREGFRASSIKRYCLFAFDMRWSYTTEVGAVWNRVRPQLLHLLPEAQGFLLVRPQQIAEPEGFPALWTSCLADDYALHKHAFLVPVIDNLSGAAQPNLSDAARGFLQALSIEPDGEAAAGLLHHALATLYSPAYLSDNAGGLRQGWPHIPLPRDADAFRHSAALGGRIAALLDPDIDVDGVTAGTIRPELVPVAVPATLAGATRDWCLRDWGNRTDKGITMPKRGRIEARVCTGAEAAVGAHAAVLGDDVVDIGMNAASLWRCIPRAVWECRIGGYQVLKKWLSYRDGSIIERPLSAEEVTHVQQTARRLTAILLLGPELDRSYRICATFT